MTDQAQFHQSALAKLNADSSGWLKVLYVEIWKQYVHEDQLSQQRTNVFQIVPVVLLAVLGTASSAVPKIGCATTAANHIFNLSLLLLGVIWVFVAIVMFLLSRKFQQVTYAAKLYVNLRHMHLRALERLAGVDDFGPALLEHRWRQFTASDLNKEFRPFAHIEELSSFDDLNIGANNHFGGFSYLRSLNNIWRTLFWIVFFVGVALMLLAHFGPTYLYKLLPSLSCGL